jgi:hypothetical protein
MSEYQYIAFRAVDGPVTGKNLEYMRRQSSRAEITPWQFDNEYQYGDFHGDAKEMLRRGYDVHLHYANFGIRKLMIRLPHGLPDPKAAALYFMDESLTVQEDKRGPGGILCIEPYFEAGELDELWEVDECVDNLLPLRAELLDGDLRPLYIAHLAVAGDDNHDPDECTEGPVPAGLNKLTDAQKALIDWLGLSEALVAAAAKKSPPLPERDDVEDEYTSWLQRQSETMKNTWLAQLLADPNATVRREILAAFQKDQRKSAWPTVPSDRTVAQLRTAAEEVQQQMDRATAEKAARARAKKLSQMQADPSRTIAETERLAEQRSRDSYDQIATLLADLREALAGTEQADLPDEQARTLRQKHPTLKMLVSALRKKGFLVAD